MGKTIVILGGGVGGLVAANELRDKLSKEHRIVLVDREAAFVFSPSLLWLMTGDRSAPKISKPLARLRRKGIELIHGEIQAIDAERRQVSVDGQMLTGDFLLIALGAELTPDSIPGLSEAGHNFYSLRGAETFQDPQVVLDEVYRVLRAGGRIVVGELGRYSTWALRRRIKGMLGDPIWSQARFHSPRDLEGLLRAARFDNPVARGAVFYPPVPNATLLPLFHAVERTGRRFSPWAGAFLAVRGSKC